MRAYLTVFAATCAALACSTGPDSDAKARAETRGRVQVVFDGPTVYLDARFSRARGVAPAQADLLAGLQSPSGLALDRCRIDSDDEQLERSLAVLPAGGLTLLDAGTIELSVAGRTVSLDASQKPALYPYVSGVEYRTAAIEAEHTRTVRVVGSGGPDVSAFDARSAVPSAISDLTARRDGLGHLVLSWRGMARSSGVFAVAELASGRQLRCRTADDGTMTLSTRLVPAGDQIAALALERWVFVPFSAGALDLADLEVGVRRVVSARTFE